MVKLFILGPTEIRNPDGSLEHSFLAGPKRLALLIFLLLNRPFGFHRRDSLLTLFWPEYGQKSARNALSNLLYHIRKTLGTDVIVNRGSEEIMIDPNNFWSDIAAFNKTKKEGDLERALEFYRGDLLNGLYVPQASPEFEQWLEIERNRYRGLATKCAWKLSVNAEKKQELESAEKWAKKALGLNPLCEETMESYLSLLVRIGTPKKGLSAYKQFVNRLKKELDEEPSGELVKIADRISSNFHDKHPLNLNGKQNGVEIPRNKQSLNNRIAVLPFETLGKRHASTFTDAIHGDILTRMSNLSNLHVTSRESVLKFRNQDSSLRVIAEELGVEWILGGEVQEAKDQVQVNVRLMNATEDRQVWAQNYLQDLKSNDFFKVQKEITQKIAVALEMKLNKEDKLAMLHSPTKNLESYCLHAQGRWCLDQRTDIEIRKALSYFRQALDLDPEYALAWVGLADTLILQNDYGYEEESLTLPEAEYAANKALSLEPEMAETNATLALLLAAKRDGPAANKMLKKTVALRPNYAEAYNWLSWGSLCMGDAIQGLQNSKKAVELNPLSPEALSNLSLSLLSNGDYENSLKEAKRIQHIQPEWNTSYLYEGLALFHLEKYEDAINVLKNLTVPWAGSGPKITLAQAYIRLGETTKLNKLQNEFLKNNDHLAMALIHATNEEQEPAFKQLLKIKNWDYWANLSLHHFFPNELGGLRKQDRFKEIYKRNIGSWKISD